MDSINTWFAKVSKLCNCLYELVNILISYCASRYFLPHLHSLVNLALMLADLSREWHTTDSMSYWLLSYHSQLLLENMFPDPQVKVVYLSPWAAHAVSHRLWPSEHFGCHRCLQFGSVAMWSVGIALPGDWGLQRAKCYFTEASATFKAVGT